MLLLHKWKIYNVDNRYCNHFENVFYCFFSWVNVLVYSVREKKFRSTVRDIFRNFKSSVNLEGFTWSKSTATSKVKNS